MMHTKRWKRRAAVFLLGASVALAVPAVQSPVEAQTTGPGAGGEYFPVDPTRVLNTRQAGLDIAPAGRKRTDPDGETYRIKVTGKAGVPEENVLAVAVSVIAIQPSLRGNLAIQPAGSGSAASSIVNFEQWDTVPNLGIVGVNPAGEIEIVAKTSGGVGDMDLIVDLYGWIATSGYDDAADEGARVRTITPERHINTRKAGQLPPAMSSPRQLRPRESIEIPIRGRYSVPNSENVTAVIVNLTGANAVGRSHLALTPERPDGPRSTTNGNYPPGVARANLGIVPLSDNGSIWLTNGDGPIHAIIDVLGYLEKGADESTDAGRTVPLDRPFRSFNTKLSEFGSVRLGNSQWEDWSFSKFADSVEIGGQSNLPQQGFFGNLVGFQLQNSDRTHITINPREPSPFTSPPPNSNVNILAAQASANMALIRYGSDGSDDAVVSAFNSRGSIHYHLDVYAVVLDD